MPAPRNVRPLALAGGLAALVVAGFFAWRLYAGWRLESELRPIRQQMATFRFEQARQRLEPLAQTWGDHPEVAYSLGVCLHATGHIDEAIAAWKRVPPASPPWTIKAGLALSRTLVGGLGRFSDGEDVLLRLRQDPEPGTKASRDEVRHTLAELYFWEGRRDTMRRLIVDGWRDAWEPIAELRNHWRVDNSIILVEMIRSEVERAAKKAPDDDRVWLAEANVAILTADFARAQEKLDACLKRRPVDHAVWRARLDLALAKNDAAAVRDAAAHLAADSFDPDERLWLRAWISRADGDVESEKTALEELVRYSPADGRALERLATLEADAGQQDRAKELRRRKSEADRARDRYRLILGDDVKESQLGELGLLAEQLGRRFEANGWLTLREFFVPGDFKAHDARQRIKALPEAEPVQPGVTLASLMPAPKSQPAVGLIVANATPAPAVFDDRAIESGLTFTFENGRSRERQMPETTGGGVGLLDYDGDGWMDVYVTQGGSFPPRAESPSTGDRLFRNKGDGTFEDATRKAGIDRLPPGYGHGVTVGDVDNDGHPDLFLTRWRSYALFRNKGDGTFEDATAAFGLGGDRDWPTSAAFADLDNDGDLDLYVCHYLVWDADHPTLCNRVTAATEKERTDPNQQYNYCTPRLFPALQDHLFRNDGGKFVDVTIEAGIKETEGRGLGVLATDVDQDGKIDLFVANDTTANYLWRNLGGMKFEDVAPVAGVASNAEGAFQAGMGTATGDLDGDGAPDLFVTNFYGESTTFFRNLGQGLFGDQTAAIGLAAPSRFLLGFGISTLDADNDSWLDLAIANGHVNDDRPDYPYDMPALLLRGSEGGLLTDVTKQSGEGWSVPRIGRGLAIGDLDNDGQVDAVMLPQMSPMAYLRNRGTPAHSITLQLEGVKSNRDGVGARIVVKSDGLTRTHWRFGGGSFQSAGDPRIHVGLAEKTSADVEIHWPSGRVDTHKALKADRGYRVKEGDATPRELPGPWKPGPK